MIKTFNCPNCGAPLDSQDPGDLTVRCPFCHNSVIVPEELRPTSPAPVVPTAETVPDKAVPEDPALARLQELASTVTDPKDLKHIERIERKMIRHKEKDEERRQRRQERNKS